MTKSAVIYDLIREVKPPEPEGIFPALRSLAKVVLVVSGVVEDSTSIMREHLFSVVRENGNQNDVVYASIKGINLRGTDNFPRLSGKQSHDRDRILQNIVNELEGEGYECDTSQLALLMSQKIDKLIVTKSR